MLAMVAAGTIGFIGCSKKDVANAPMSSPHKLRLLSAFAIGRYAKDYWVTETNSLSSAFKPLFDRFTQDPKLFIYEYIDMSVIGFLIGYTQDNQITKGTRVAALYSYSDIIFILKENAGYCSCYSGTLGPYTVFHCCTKPGGAKCKELGRTCGSTHHKTYLQYLYCL